VDVLGLVRDYIQHGLRQIEALEGEAQARAVRLLHLFVRNLLVKGFVVAEQIRFELLELGMRYVWVKEIREDPLLADAGLSLWAT